MNLSARDCSPLDPQPVGEQVQWLRRLQQSVRPGDHVVALGEGRDDEAPVVYCERDGTWWAGRYVGSLTFEGHSLTIAPRFGIETLREWLSAVTQVALVESRGRLRDDASFIVQLLAAVWARAFVDAARHGLPALRKDSHFVGRVARGRIDVAATARLHASGNDQLYSVRRERSLDHAVSAVIVAAFRVLQRWMGVQTTQWLPQRTQELLPHLQAVTGPRPAVPSKIQLARIRYSPITQSFRSFAELSRRIALHRGLYSDIDPDGRCRGILLDIAELWELYVLAVLRQAVSGMDVRHGTRDTGATAWLLRDKTGNRGMARLKPDALLSRAGRVAGIADAKYKSLRPAADAPYGVQREDLYQMTTYLARFAAGNPAVWGLLCYPQHFESQVPAEELSPWRLEQGQRVWFLTLPHTRATAVAKLRATVLGTGKPSIASYREDPRQ